MHNDIKFLLFAYHCINTFPIEINSSAKSYVINYYFICLFFDIHEFLMMSSHTMSCIRGYIVCSIVCSPRRTRDENQIHCCTIIL